MPPRPLLRRLGTIALLSVLAIALHECGHFLVYRLGGFPVRVSLQSVRPIGVVDPTWNTVALLAGPAMSWLVAIVCLVVSSRRDGFGWAAAAFTNATLRLFPCAMDVARALRSGPAFSDEGDVALHFTHSVGGRLSLLAPAILISLALTTLAARRFRFSGRVVLKSVAVYAFSLVVCIAVVIVDELLIAK